MALRAVLPALERLSDATLPSTRLWPRPGPDAQPTARARRCPRQALEKDSGASSRTADHACGCRDEQDSPAPLQCSDLR